MEKEFKIEIKSQISLYFPIWLSFIISGIKKEFIDKYIFILDENKIYSHYTKKEYLIKNIKYISKGIFIDLKISKVQNFLLKLYKLKKENIIKSYKDSIIIEIDNYFVVFYPSNIIKDNIDNLINELKNKFQQLNINPKYEIITSNISNFKFGFITGKMIDRRFFNQYFIEKK